MNPLLLSGFGTSINVDKRKLVIQNRLKNQKLEFHPHKIDYDSVIVDNHAGNITFDALRWLSKHDIPLALLNWNGNLLSVSLPEASKNGKLRVKQYEKYYDNEFRFNIASKIIQCKITHSVNLIEELSKYYYFVDIKKFKKMILDEQSNFKLECIKKNSRSKDSLNLLLTLEGRIATLYWSQLSQIFKKLCPDFGFDGRKNKTFSRNYNAADEINCLLNYGYSILESQVRKVINSVGLDPSIGFLHEITQGREPLVYDLQELFRWIIDLSIVQLLEEKKLKKSDFIITENYHMRLREKTAKMLIDKIKFNFNLKVPFKQNKNYYYQVILADNVQRLSHCLINKLKDFEFNIPQIKLNRNDTVLFKEKILRMTPKERKRLGINKSTLWYIKKNLKNGKKVKFYDKVISKLNNEFI